MAVLFLRKAVPEDIGLLFKWANDADVRRSALNSRKITWIEHQRWFQQKMADRNCFQYIALNQAGHPVGQIRFDITDSIADIDYSVDGSSRGSGIGGRLLACGVEAVKREISSAVLLQGRVKYHNAVSEHIFKKAGFFRVAEVSAKEKDDGGRPYYVYQLKIHPGQVKTKPAEKQHMMIANEGIFQS